MPQDRANLAVITNPAYDKYTDAEQSRQLELIGTLQTTLVLDQLLQLFSREIQTVIPHDGFRYSNQVLGMEVQGGERASHSCNYSLVLEEQKLGELTLMRRKRFNDRELAQLENQLCCLLYPLRNAVLYYQALQSAYTDPLTQVYNRAALNCSFQREWKLAQRQRTPLSLLLLDIDYFKKINDTFGHTAGDAALAKIAHCLRQSVRASDMIFRYGGEEFLILLSNTSGKGAQLLAERIRKQIRDMDCSDISPNLRITTSLGVATLSHPEDTPQQLLKRADDALYQAKRKGRDRTVVA